MDQRLDAAIPPGLSIPGNRSAHSSVAAPNLDRAFARIAAAELHPGNAVRLLRDAGENYPAWLDAIRSAKATIHFETFIIAEDATGRVFAEALMERAAAGVDVRFVYDWLGSTARAFPSFFARMRNTGVSVRVFSPLRLSSPLWIRRDHRKLLAVDGAVGFVSGLCVSDDWTGNPARGVDPWRDTGVEIRGPAVADLDASFAEIWALAGPRLPESAPSRSDPATGAPAGSVPVRVVAGRPGQLSAYRLDLLIAASARRSLWLTDAYFLGSRAYVQALSEAARDGVDVRLLLPAASDVPLLQPLVQAGHRPLVEAGVRVFEWDGPMLHAKTAVADGAWARVGSTNLNMASWTGNWELDVAIEDEGFAAAMEAMFLDDLSHSTEIVPGVPRRTRSRTGRRPERRASRSDLRRLAAGAAALGRTAGAAMAGSRPLTAVEARSAAVIGAALLLLAAAVTLFPVLLVSPVVIMLAWTSFALLRRAWQLRAVTRPAKVRRRRAPR
jgi:cardiolipin synthase A/B